MCDEFTKKIPSEHFFPPYSTKLDRTNPSFYKTRETLYGQMIWGGNDQELLATLTLTLHIKILKSEWRRREGEERETRALQVKKWNE